MSNLKIYECRVSSTPMWKPPCQHPRQHSVVRGQGGARRARVTQAWISAGTTHIDEAEMLPKAQGTTSTLALSFTFATSTWTAPVSHQYDSNDFRAGHKPDDYQQSGPVTAPSITGIEGPKLANFTFQTRFLRRSPRPLTFCSLKPNLPTTLNPKTCSDSSTCDLNPAITPPVDIQSPVEAQNRPSVYSPASSSSEEPSRPPGSAQYGTRSRAASAERFNFLKRQRCHCCPHRVGKKRASRTSSRHNAPSRASMYGTSLTPERTQKPLKP